MSLFFATAVLAQDTARPAANERNAISVSATLAQSAARVFAAATRALGELGFAVADSSSTRGKVTTSPVYVWPAGSEKESWHGAESPGVVVQVVARAISPDSTYFAVTAIAPVRTVVGGDSAAITLRMLSALRVANRVSALLEEPSAPKP